MLKGVAEAAARAARAAHGAEGTLTVGFTSSAAAHPLIPRALRVYRDNWPGVSLRFFREGNAAELTEALTAGTLDIGILRLPVGGPPGLSFLSLLEEEMLLVLPVGHPALARSRAGAMPSISLKALKDDLFILVRRHGAPGMYSNLVAACERERVHAAHCHRSGPHADQHQVWVSPQAPACRRCRHRCRASTRIRWCIAGFATAALNCARR